MSQGEDFVEVLSRIYASATKTLMRLERKPVTDSALQEKRESVDN